MVKTIKTLNLKNVDKENIKGYIEYLYNKGSINSEDVLELKKYYENN